MALMDPSRAVAYLGRPCQFLAEAELLRCDPALWTGGRFSEDAVAATDQAVEALKRSHGASRLNLVGYSGGGAMAALVAARRSDVRCLVTVAAPLDTHAWTDAIKVSRLATSLNPADYATRLNRVSQVHFRGKLDTLVPPHTQRRFLALTSARVIDRESYDHVCCWERDWAELAAQSCLQP